MSATLCCIWTPPPIQSRAPPSIARYQIPPLSIASKWMDFRHHFIPIPRMAPAQVSRQKDAAVRGRPSAYTVLEQTLSWIEQLRTPVGSLGGV